MERARAGEREHMFGEGGKARMRKQDRTCVIHERLIYIYRERDGEAEEGGWGRERMRRVR